MRILAWLVGVPALAACALVLWLVPDWSFLKGEVTVYSARCRVDVVDNFCADPLFTVGPETFRVSEDRQEVLSRRDGFPPSRLTECAVVDRLNWQCKYSDGSAQLGFTDGTYFSNPLGTSRRIITDYKERYYFFSRTEYLKLKFRRK